MERAELIAFYRRYLQCCNDRRFAELDRVADGRIVESWGDLGSAVRDQLTWGAPA